MSKRLELEQAARCGLDAIRSMRRAIADAHPGTAWDHDLLHAMRMTRLAVYHAFKARPDLRQPDAYDLAVQQHRRRTA